MAKRDGEARRELLERIEHRFRDGDIDDDGGGGGGTERRRSSRTSHQSGSDAKRRTSGSLQVPGTDLTSSIQLPLTLFLSIISYIILHLALFFIRVLHFGQTHRPPGIMAAARRTRRHHRTVGTRTGQAVSGVIVKRGDSHWSSHHRNNGSKQRLDATLFARHTKRVST